MHNDPPLTPFTLRIVSSESSELAERLLRMVAKGSLSAKMRIHGIEEFISWDPIDDVDDSIWLLDSTYLACELTEVNGRLRRGILVGGTGPPEGGGGWLCSQFTPIQLHRALSKIKSQRRATPMPKVSARRPGGLVAPNEEKVGRTFSDKDLAFSNRDLEHLNSVTTPESQLSTNHATSTFWTVVGAGGTGTSTVAALLSQSLASHGASCLVDLRLRGEQALLHNIGRSKRGLAEFILGHRNSSPTTLPSQFVHRIPTRGYDLMAAMPSLPSWRLIDHSSLDAALHSLSRSYRSVVFDCDLDLEDRSVSGSMDIEERNMLTRSAIRSSSALVLVAQPGVKGLYSLSRLHREVLESKLVRGPIGIVINRYSPSPRKAREFLENLGDVLDQRGSGQPVKVIFLPDTSIESQVLATARFPASLASPIELLSATLSTLANFHPAAPQVPATLATKLSSTGPSTTSTLAPSLNVWC